MAHDVFPSTSDTRTKGRLAETSAVQWLRKAGYEVVETNYAIRAGEIDIIGIECDTLCFVEVKARRTADYGPAIEAVSARKQRRITKAASAYLIGSEWEGPCRFDVLGLDADGPAWRYTLVRNAFEGA